MQAHIVFTFMAPDKPGVLAKVASVVTANEGSWLESRLARLGGQFTGIVRLEVPTGEATELKSALRALEDEAFRISLMDEASSPLSQETQQKTIEVLGVDRPGIVHEVSRTLIKHHINVEDLFSEIRSAPMSGESLFDAEIQVHLPEGLDADQLQDELDAIADELDLDIRLR